MTAVYSKLLTSGFSLGTGLTTLGGPPPGFAWIVKDIIALWPDFRGYGLQGFMIHDTPGLPLFGRQYPYVSGGIVYHWSGAQVLEVPNELLVLTGENDWQLRISGYELTLP